MKQCQNCINSIMGEHVKSGKYRNFVYTCKIYEKVIVLDYWKKTEALTCVNFKEE